jgi:hypothetical protein
MSGAAPSWGAASEHLFVSKDKDLAPKALKKMHSGQALADDNA